MKTSECQEPAHVYGPTRSRGRVCCFWTVARSARKHRRSHDTIRQGHLASAWCLTLHELKAVRGFDCDKATSVRRQSGACTVGRVNPRNQKAVNLWPIQCYVTKHAKDECRMVEAKLCLFHR